MLQIGRNSLSGMLIRCTFATDPKLHEYGVKVGTPLHIDSTIIYWRYKVLTLFFVTHRAQLYYERFSIKAHNVNASLLLFLVFCSTVTLICTLRH